MSITSSPDEGSGRSSLARVQLLNELPNEFGYTCTVTVNGHYPASGKAYVNIHLDYGVKGAGLDVNPADTFADRYDAGSTFCTGVGR